MKFDTIKIRRVMDEFDKILAIIYEEKDDFPRGTSQVCREFAELMEKFRKERIPEIYGDGYIDPF